MKQTLKIFVVDDCLGCVETFKIAAYIEKNYPQICLELIDLNDPEAIIPDAVFAAPTFMLNHRIVSLGNPSYQDVVQWFVSS